MHKYYEILYQYGSIIACATSILLLIPYVIGVLQFKQFKITIYLVFAIGTLITVEFYPIQIGMFHVNVIFPITYAVIIYDAFSQKSKAISYILFGVHSVSMIMGIMFLSSSANTWGDGAATVGVFMTPVSALINLYQYTKIENLTFIAIGKISVGFLSCMSILIFTHGFSVGDYDYNDVFIRRIVAISCSMIILMEGLIIAIWRNRLKEYSKQAAVN